MAEGTTRASVVPTARMQACEENRRRVQQPKREACPLHRRELLPADPMLQASAGARCTSACPTAAPSAPAAG